MDKPIKDKQLRQYELMEYFGAIARATDAVKSGDIILQNIAEDCPAQYLEDIDSYICGKLLGMVEICLDALQSVPHDRTTPSNVKAALAHIGTFLADVKDPLREELREIVHG